MKKILSLVLALCLLVLTVSLCACGKKAEDGVEKSITVVVIDDQGTETRHTFTTARAYLADALLDEKIVEGDMSTYGLYITSVDGLVADYSVNSAWWAVYEGEEMSMNGVSQIEIVPDGLYKLVYTIG